MSKKARFKTVLSNPNFKNRQVKGCKFDEEGIYDGEVNTKQLEVLKAMGCKEIGSKPIIEKSDVKTSKVGK